MRIALIFCVSRSDYLKKKNYGKNVKLQKS